jgi:DNA repair photolyase
VARELGVPLIVSTKSSLVAEPPWLDAVKELAGEGLAIVQLSVAFLDDSVARRLEPGAPPPRSG